MADEDLHVHVDGEPLSGDTHKRIQDALKKTLESELHRERGTRGYVAEDDSSHASSTIHAKGGVST
jgi:hypothetical protein